ncbi:hypothetical protein CerSpe_092050 [Prunus speciosa]
MGNNRLLDIGFKGQLFTWECSHDDSIVIRERLDRGMANSEWLEHWPNSTIFHCTQFRSDHCPLMMENNPRYSKRKKCIKFDANWIDQPDCGQIISTYWNSSQHGSQLSQWKSNMWKCRNKLIKWSRSRPQKKKVLISGLLDELNSIETNLQTKESILKQRAIKFELGDLWKLEELYWKQRSRVKWLKEGDTNSRFFHLTTIQRRQNNHILRIKNSQGSWLVREHDVCLEFQGYFLYFWVSPLG